MKKIVVRLATILVALVVSLAATAGVASASTSSGCKTAFGRDVPTFLCHTFTYEQPGPPTRDDAIALCILQLLADPPAGAASVVVSGSSCAVAILNPQGLNKTDSLVFCLIQYLADPWKTSRAIGVNGISCGVDVIGG
jgi:hypothetical protein